MESKQKLAQELGILEKQQVTQEQILELQTLVANLADQIAVRKDKVDVPFATKQRIVRLLIQQILLNVAEQRLQMDGVISGTFPLLSA
jgi:hypothetical protein